MLIKILLQRALLVVMQHFTTALRCKESLYFKLKTQSRWRDGWIWNEWMFLSDKQLDIQDRLSAQHKCFLIHLSLTTSVQQAAGVNAVFHWIDCGALSSCLRFTCPLLSSSQESLWAHATWTFAGSLSTSRGASWSSALGRMTVGCWTSRWMMLTSQATCPMESGT